ncbi:MAG: ATP-binding cassette domain-containing protein, partial [Pseudomonadota bacterium]
RIKKQGQAKLTVNRSELSGKMVVELDNISFSYDEQPVIKDFSTAVMRGDRVGIIGPNGAGKSTLLRLLLDQLQPSEGKTKLGTKLETAYFDQQREQLDLNSTVRENLGEGTDYVTIAGKQKHIISYLQDFLFPPARIDSPVNSLSGGERNRLLLARVFSKPSNLLVLDEPTNDLDVETLELLEELLADYSGTLMLVSHDRAFLDNVVTSTIVFEGNGELAEYVGGYEDWLRQCPKPAEAAKETSKPAVKKSEPKAPQKQKLSYKEKRELELLPETIEQLEAEQSGLEQKTAEPGFYKQDKAAIAETMGRLEQISEELAAAYERWEYLDGLE